MTSKNFIEEVKNKLGEDFPNDLIFESKKGNISFYKKKEPFRNCILDFKNINKNEYTFYINECERRIRMLYIN